MLPVSARDQGGRDLRGLLCPGRDHRDVLPVPGVAAPARRAQQVPLLFFLLPHAGAAVAAVREGEGEGNKFLCCSFCFHTLALQWQQYEKVRAGFIFRISDFENALVF